MMSENPEVIKLKQDLAGYASGVVDGYLRNLERDLGAEKVTLEMWNGAKNQLATYNRAINQKITELRARLVTRMADPNFSDIDSAIHEIDGDMIAGKSAPASVRVGFLRTKYSNLISPYLAAR